MRHYKVEYGFEPEDYISIDETELEKAIYAAMVGGRVAFKEGFIDCSRKGIIIKPDYHAAMGWARGHTLETDDYNELSDRGVDRDHKIFQAKTKERVEYLVAHGQEKLIGKNEPIPELDRPQTRSGNGPQSMENLLKDRLN